MKYTDLIKIEESESADGANHCANSRKSTEVSDSTEILSYFVKDMGKTTPTLIRKSSCGTLVETPPLSGVGDSELCENFTAKLRASDEPRVAESGTSVESAALAEVKIVEPSEPMKDSFGELDNINKTL